MEIKQKRLDDILGVPAVLYGEKREKLWIFVHGKCGNKEEAEAFAKIACENGAQVLGIDLPEHGERKNEHGVFNPWHAIPELEHVAEFARENYLGFSVRANSIGAYFSMLAFKKEPEKALFVSPIVDMERLICDMLLWAGVSEKELAEKGAIETDFGETLSWEYLCWVREHPVSERLCPLFLLYGEKDSLTSIETAAAFAEKHRASLEIMPCGEHWFHTEEQLSFLENWEKKNF